MSAVEPYSTADLREETPRLDGPPPRTAPPRRGLRRGLGLLAGLIVLAVVGVLAYNVGTSYFALNGEWYGPLRVQVGPGRVSLEAYMDLATYLNGSLSGSGKVCYQNRPRRRDDLRGPEGLGKPERRQGDYRVRRLHVHSRDPFAQHRLWAGARPPWRLQDRSHRRRRSLARRSPASSSTARPQ